MSKSQQGTLYDPPYYLEYPSIQVNRHLNNGGIPAGSIIQVQSDGEATFKTSACIRMLASAQDQGLTVGYIDAEGAISENSRPWLEGMGLNVDECYFKGPDTGENLWKQVETWTTEDELDVIVLDSIHAVQPSKLYNNEVGHHHIGNHAMLHKQGLIKTKSLVQEHDLTFIAVNHKKVNLTSQGAFGKKATGGSAWGFYSEFIFVHSRTTSQSKLEGENLIPLNIYIEKNKGGQSFVDIKTYAKQDTGISLGAEMLMLGLKEGVFKKKGSWYSIKDGDDWETIAQGETSTINWIDEHESKVKGLLNEQK